MKLTAVLAIAILAGVSEVSADTKNVVCYFGTWAVYRTGLAKIGAADIQPNLCTHFIYGFVGLDETTNSVVLLDSWNDIGDTWKIGLLPLIRDRCRASGTKFMVAMGGWNEGSLKYSNVIGNPVRRRALIQSIVSFVTIYKLDGFDIDWEYPAQRGGRPSDRNDFSAFITELKAALGPNSVLSAAVTANVEQYDQSYDIPLLSNVLDMINVMTYDLHGSWEAVTGHNAPLYARPSDYPSNSHLCIAAAIQGWLDRGANPQKINLGLAAYGRSFTLLDANQNAIGAPAGGNPPAGWTGEAGFYGYDQLCYEKDSWTTYFDDTQKVPYAVKGRNWVGYDTPDSLQQKVCFAKELNLGGVMIWSIETDDFRGNCGQGTFPLVNAMRKGIADPTCGAPGSSQPSPTTQVPQPPPTTQAPQPSSTTLAPQPSSTTQAPQPPSTTEVPQPPQPTPAPQPSTSTQTPQPAPTTQYPQPSPTTQDPQPTTQAPQPSTSEPSTQSPPPLIDATVEDTSIATTAQPARLSVDPAQCKYPGDYLKNPNDCSSYFVCVIGADGKMITLQMHCALGTGYDPSNRVCQYRSLLRC